jgi:anti-sigma B factor antagonist
MSDIETDIRDGVIRVYLRDPRLNDDPLVESVGAQLNTLLNDTEHRKLIINMRDVSMMNSSMIGKLIQLNNRCREESIELHLCELNDNLMEVFSLMQLPRILKIHESEAAAVAALG